MIDEINRLSNNTMNDINNIKRELFVIYHDNLQNKELNKLLKNIDRIENKIVRGQENIYSLHQGKTLKKIKPNW